MWPSTNRQSYSARRKNDRDLKLDYFSHVLADFHRLEGSVRKEISNDLPQCLAALIDKMASCEDLTPAEEDSIDWGDIAILEDKILSRQDDDTVRRRAWQLRARFKGLVGPDRYQIYLSSNPPDENNANTPIGTLKADLRRVLSATHFNYNLTLVCENLRRRASKRVFAVALFVSATMLIAAGVLLGFDDRELAGTVCAVALFGLLGAYISIQRRVQEARDRGDPVIAALGLIEFFNVYSISLSSGALFAIVMFYILQSGFVKGDLFPNFEMYPIPQNMENWSKLLIWSLIAGFAERLIPDTLDRLVSQGRPAGMGAAPDPQAPAGQGNNVAPPNHPPDGTPGGAAGIDPNRGQFGGAAENGEWKLTATAVPDAAAPAVKNVEATVTKIGDAAATGSVVFHLSKDFQESEVSADISAGKGQAKFQSPNPFVVGAVVTSAGQTVKLELDLESVWPK